MLTLLHIENIAVVERAQIEPGRGLNILTGETGAGKSIIIDAIGVIAGERASKDLIRTGENNAVVSALFSDLSPSVLNWLHENGYAPDEDGNILIYRQISSEGRGLCKINGMPVTVTQLRELGSLLINIHGQHENQSLLYENTHLQYLDSFAGHDDLLKIYSDLYNQLKKIDSDLRSMKVDENEKARLIEHLTYRIEEIERADLKIGEDEALEARREILRNSESMIEGLEMCFRALYGDEDAEGACGLLNSAEYSFSAISAIDSQLEPLQERLTDVRYVVEDLANEIRDLRDTYVYSPEEIEQVESRLDLIFRLKRKYGDSIESILETLERDKEELDRIEFSEKRLARLTAKRDEIYAKTIEAGKNLTRSRSERGAELSQLIMESLTKLDMPKVQFKVEISPLDEPGPDGLDEVRFLLSANPGEQLRSISRIASGGELSRIMLAMKNVLIKNDDIQTLIFDEVDSGVSGRAAQRVAEMLAGVSEEKQVLCVTHLSQIAAMADNHFRVEKSERGGRVFTTVKLLDEDSAIEEIARIISATAITELTLKSAGEMIADAKAYKKRG